MLSSGDIAPFPVDRPSLRGWAPFHAGRKPIAKERKLADPLDNIKAVNRYDAGANL